MISHVIKDHRYFPGGFKYGKPHVILQKKMLKNDLAYLPPFRSPSAMISPAILFSKGVKLWEKANLKRPSLFTSFQVSFSNDFTGNKGSLLFSEGVEIWEIAYHITKEDSHCKTN
jgi:hypothetical protein